MSSTHKKTHQVSLRFFTRCMCKHLHRPRRAFPVGVLAQSIRKLRQLRNAPVQYRFGARGSSNQLETREIGGRRVVRVVHLLPRLALNYVFHAQSRERLSGNVSAQHLYHCIMQLKLPTSGIRWVFVRNVRERVCVCGSN